MSSNDTPLVVKIGDELPAASWKWGMSHVALWTGELGVPVNPHVNTIYDEPEFCEYRCKLTCSVFF